MPLYTYRAVGNGLRTDHPIPGLPFIDDAHIPVDDPAGIEATGRHHGGDTWGRQDQDRRYGGWAAFTTDPLRHDLAWCVRWHPEHGRSVVVYRDRDAAGVHMTWWGTPALLFREGGYWWDGTAWYRPAQLWDAAGEEYYRRPVPACATVTAHDLLSSGDAAAGQLLAITDLGPGTAVEPVQWGDDLALWAQRRDGAGLRDCVVTVTAAELGADQMVGPAQMAQIGGIAASTLRAYLARGEGDLPLPQAVVGGRSLWARPVAEEWAEQRQRSAAGVTQAVSTRHASGASVPAGVADVWAQFTRSFFSRLWDSAPVRKRWALRWRTEAAVRDIAEDLGWEVAASLDQIIPIGALSGTIQHAMLDELAEGQRLARSLDGDTPPSTSDFYGITPDVARMLDWQIRHQPRTASAAIGAIIGEAERRLEIPRKVTENSLRTALSLDGQLDDDTLRQFLSRVITPASGNGS